MDGYSIVIQKHPSKHPIFNYKWMIGTKIDGLRSDVRGTSIKTYDKKSECIEEMTKRIKVMYAMPVL